jgi:hypothetical protein
MNRVYIVMQHGVPEATFDSYEDANTWAKQNGGTSILGVQHNPPIEKLWHVGLTIYNNKWTPYNVEVHHYNRQPGEISLTASGFHVAVNATDRDDAIAKAKQLLINKMLEG